MTNMIQFFVRLFLITLGMIQMALASSAFEQGNAAYQAKKYATALTHYQSALKEGASANLWYNMGNAYYQSGDHARAVHAFSEALRLQPRDRATQHNLTIARKSLQLPAPKRDMRWATGHLTRNEYAGLTILALAWLALFAWRGHSTPRGFNIIFNACAAIFLTASIIAWLSHRHAPNEAMIIAPEATLHLSPLAASEVLGKTASGSLVHLGKQHAGYVFIEDSDATKRGWISETAISQLRKW